MSAALPKESTCVCCVCGRPVNPDRLTVMHGVLRAYVMTQIILDEDTGTPRLVHYLKCTDCLGPDETKRIQRYEALHRSAHHGNAPLKANYLPAPLNLNDPDDSA